MPTLKRLWNDETGAILSTELILIGTVLIIGVLVGLKSVRDAVVTELADVAQAFSSANQSFWFANQAGNNGSWQGSGWGNSWGNGQGGNGNTSGGGSCINVCAGAVAEGNS